MTFCVIYLTPAHQSVGMKRTTNGQMAVLKKMAVNTDER